MAGYDIDGDRVGGPMSSGVPPLGKIVYVCDDVVRNPVSGNTDVIGLFSTVRPLDGVTYPFYLPQLCVFAQFAGGFGPMVVEARITDASTGAEVSGSPPYTVQFPGGQVIVTVVIRMLDCRFPHPGTYLVQLFCQRTFIDDRRLRAR